MEMTIELKIKEEEKIAGILATLFGNGQIEEVPSAGSQEPIAGNQLPSAGSQVPSETKEEVQTYPDDEELRQQMDIVISKFAGNNWKENKEPRVLAIRKGCTAAFKEISKWLGAEKPTALAPEKRLEFVNHLQDIYIEEKGEGKMPEISFRPY